MTTNRLNSEIPEYIEKIAHETCLRPVFTLSRVRDLLNYRSANIIGDFHTGKGQTLKDIISIFPLLPNINVMILEAIVQYENLKKLEDFSKIVQLNGKSCFESFSDIQIAIDTHLDSNASDKLPKIVLFVIHNFDMILHNEQQSIEIEKLLDSLRALKTSGVSFLTCGNNQKLFKRRVKPSSTGKAYETAPFHIDAPADLNPLHPIELSSLIERESKRVFEYVEENNLINEWHTLQLGYRYYYMLNKKLIESINEKIIYNQNINLKQIISIEYTRIQKRVKDNSWYTIVNKTYDGITKTHKLIGSPKIKISAFKLITVVIDWIENLVQKSLKK